MSSQPTPANNSETPYFDHCTFCEQGLYRLYHCNKKNKYYYICDECENTYELKESKPELIDPETVSDDLKLCHTKEEVPAHLAEKILGYSE